MHDVMMTPNLADPKEMITPLLRKALTKYDVKPMIYVVSF